MTESEPQKELCVTCGKPLGDARYGSGSKDDGYFCSLACFADKHGERLARERAAAQDELRQN